jgi:hypothetical protein
MKNVLLAGICLFSSILNAQLTGSEWIDFTKPHLKYKTDQEELVRINFFAAELGLLKLGTRIQSVPLDKYRVFSHGQQIPLLITDLNKNNTWDPDDYIEFVTHKEDGHFDSLLYEDKRHQRHKLQSMYTDFRAYYLTYRDNGVQAKYTNATATPPSTDPPKASHQSVVTQFGDDLYFSGKLIFLGGTAASLSDYTFGEGFYGPRLNVPRTSIPGGFRADSSKPMITIPIIAPEIDSSGFKPTITVGTVNSIAYYSFFSHWLIYKVSPNGSSNNRRIGDTITKQNVHVVQSLDLKASDFDSDGLMLQLYNAPLNSYPINFLPGYGFSHISLKYPRKYKLKGLESYSYLEEKNSENTNITWTGYGTGSKSNPLVFDEVNHLFFEPAYDNIDQKFSYTLPVRAQSGNIFIGDKSSTKLISVNDIHIVNWPNYSEHINNTDFIIVTDSALLDGKGTMDEYVNFKQAQFSHPVRLLFDDNLYDAFSYGINHPLAIRHYCKYLLDNSTTVKPKYLFLLGRGFEPIFNRGLNLRNTVSQQNRNYIPMMGQPASDNLLVAGLDGTQIEPAISVGRYPADEPEDIENYLNKQRVYLSNSNQYVDWRKNVLQLGGGINSNQSSLISNRLKSLSDLYVKEFPFNGTVYQYSKSAGNASDPQIKTNILSLINVSGLNNITFLGHGSSTTTDIDIGNPDDYVNTGKYPIFYFNGCQIGNPGKAIDLNSLGFADKIIKGKDKGGIAFIAQSSTSELYTVLTQMSQVYKHMFSDPSKSAIAIGDALRLGIKDFQRPTIDLNRIHCQQLVLQGDPSTPLYRPVLPDFSIDVSSAFLYPENTNALSDSFSIAIIVRNAGIGIKDSFDIIIDRTFDINNKITYQKRVALNKFIDTFFVTIKSKDARTKGLNIFDIEINPSRNPVEFNYLNNTVRFKTTIIGNGINLVYPKKFDIIPTKSVTLKAQPSDLFKELYGFFIEIDTTSSFTSSYLRRINGLQPVQDGVIVEWKIDDLKPVKDTQEYFWRARLSTGTSSGGDWVQSSFTYIKNHAPGWMQNNAFQYIKPASSNTMSGIKLDTVNKAFSFSPISKNLYIDAAHMTFSRMGVKESGFGSQDLNYGINFAINTGLVAMFWDPLKLERVAIDTSIQQPGGLWGGKWKTGLNYHTEDYQIYYTWDMSSINDREKFVSTMQKIPDSLYVSLFTYRLNHANLWEQDVLDALHSIGCSAMDSSSRRTFDNVYLAMGKKGWPAGRADEMVGFGEYTQMETSILGQGYSGSMTSENIGPVDTLYDLFFNRTIENTGRENDVFSIDVYGTDQNGIQRKLKTTKSSPLSLRDINTKEYPFIHLTANFVDRGAHTPANIINWRVTHSYLPDGSLFPKASNGYLFHADSIIEGDTFRVKIPFKNISTVDIRDSLDLEFELVQKTSRTVIDKGGFKINPLKSDSLFLFDYKYPTKGFEGIYGFYISVNTNNKVTEKTLINNSNTLSFVVVKDNINPLIDVTFDGRHIMDGDIVSANPNILISSTDENQFLLQQDENKLILEIQKPGGSSFTPITYGTDALFYPATDKNNKAKVEYKPSDLITGTYTLKIQSEDASLNKAGSVEYLINFNVDRNQTVTQFYPYPNPVTSSMKFVFTLTGTNVPEDIRIKIANSSGRVVKEVNKEELGAIHIGNNITDWTWNGTDQFGDMLANGPYFYTVTVKDKGEDVKLRATKGDGSFKNQTGVIYLLR